MRFTCPQCGQHIEADDDMAGQQDTCPSCQTTFTVPPDSTLPPKAEASTDIVFHCPGCCQRLAVSPEGAGLKVPCPKCGQDLVIPGAPPITGSVTPISKS